MPFLSTLNCKIRDNRNLVTKVQLQGSLEIFLNFRFRLEPDENGEEDDEIHNAP
jgi:hypothetical protein